MWQIEHKCLSPKTLHMTRTKSRGVDKKGFERFFMSSLLLLLLLCLEIYILNGEKPRTTTEPTLERLKD